jgi:hypothetical protein
MSWGNFAATSPAAVAEAQTGLLCFGHAVLGTANKELSPKRAL